MSDIEEMTPEVQRDLGGVMCDVIELLIGLNERNPDSVIIDTITRSMLQRAGELGLLLHQARVAAGDYDADEELDAIIRELEEGLNDRRN